ncbi:Z1 domain-containing protein [Glutamicibacter ardleyensis]|uniref:Z1 domain-containing protein n=1 Tax=Glutamicibacter ardleyensis TaxID=225894 RepID=UPI003FD2CE5F
MLNFEELDEEDLSFHEEMKAMARTRLIELKTQYRLDIDSAFERWESEVRRTHRRDQFTADLVYHAGNIALVDLKEDAKQRRIFFHTTGTQARGEQQDWYNGVDLEMDRFWPQLRDRMIDDIGSEITDGVDNSSDEIVAHLADPAMLGLRKKGLVVGFVQSGKTANYTAVISKALDKGYRLIIVLAGVHNNLRRQTQMRLQEDLGINEDHPDDSIFALTSDLQDFERATSPGQALFQKNVPMLAIVKKNKTRLENLNLWLAQINERTRNESPILIIDDEADQATPNTKAAMDEVSVINGLLGNLWKKVGTGSYVGYTATPFANVFMDPDEEEGLFPSDFIVALPKSEDYFGAERIFGKAVPEEAANPEEGLDIVRTISSAEAESIQPPGKKVERDEFEMPKAPKSLVEAVRWFLISTAVRRSRGHNNKHSSMLVHTTHYAAFHFQLKERVEAVIRDLEKKVVANRLEEFESHFNSEIGCASNARPEGVEESHWEEVKGHLRAVVFDCEVLVDNSHPDAERIDYKSSNESGMIIPKTAIVVGGGTLARGLTLEGLVVSYFVRTTSMYDTLLQMGRWFGYRVGYEDLPRVWTQERLIQDFQFLALVEEELRQEIQTLCQMNKTPKEIGVKIRSHPGRLQITAKNKLVHAEMVRLSYSGQRVQTFILHEKGPELRTNLATTKNFLKELSTKKTGLPDGRQNVAALYKGVTSEQVIRFLQSYVMHEDQDGLDAGRMTNWIDLRAEDIPWNVVVMRGPGTLRSPDDGSLIQLGSVDLGLEEPVSTMNRAPLKNDLGKANIKALMSAPDIILDLDREKLEPRADGKSWKFEDYLSYRRRIASGTGLLVVYPISKYSTSSRPEQKSSRRSMQADENLIGLGMLFPTPTGADAEGDGDFMSVRPDWDIESSEIEDEIIPDND